MIKLSMNIAIGALALAGAVGCGNTACDSWGERTEVAAELRALVPPGAEVCGSGNPDSVRFDAPKEANAFVMLVDHLEGMGFERKKQNISNPKSMSVHFEKDGIAISAHIHESPRGNMSVVALTRSGSQASRRP